MRNRGAAPLLFAAFQTETSLSLLEAGRQPEQQNNTGRIRDGDVSQPGNHPQLVGEEEWMNNGKVRIYDLSKELNLDNKELLAICDQLNISVKAIAAPSPKARQNAVQPLAFPPHEESGASNPKDTALPSETQT